MKLTECITTVESDIATRLGERKLTQGSLPWVLARVLGGMKYELLTFIERMSLQTFPQYATGDYLQYHAEQWGIVRKEPTSASGGIIITGVPSSVIPAGTILVSGPNTYRLLTTVNIPSYTDHVGGYVVATTKGTQTNMVGGAKLAFARPIAGVETEARTLMDSDHYIAVSGREGAYLASGTSVRTPKGTTYYTSTNIIWFENGIRLVPLASAPKYPRGNTPMILQSPPSDVDPIAYMMNAGLEGGYDAEDDLGLRQRILQRIQAPAHGGAAQDYIYWALSTPTVRVWRAWAWGYPYVSAGQVQVYLATYPEIDETDIFPSPSEIELVAQWIDSVRPATAAVQVMAPDAHTLDLEIGLATRSGYDQDVIRAEIVRQLSMTLAQYDVLPYQGTIPLAWLYSAAQSVQGVAGIVFRTINGETPTAMISIPARSLPVVGTITWSEA